MTTDPTHHGGMSKYALSGNGGDLADVGALRARIAELERQLRDVTAERDELMVSCVALSEFADSHVSRGLVRWCPEARGAAQPAVALDGPTELGERR